MKAPAIASPLAPLARIWPGALLLGLALLAAYANTFRAPFIFDDADSILRNPTLDHFSTALLPPRDSGITVSGRPLLNLSFAFNRAVGGENVTGYHATNLAIHFLAALTLFGLVHRTLLLPRLLNKFGKSPALVAWTVAAIWALHPLQTESVTYVVQRAESLAGLLYLLTLYAFVRAVDAPEPSARRWRILSVASCLLGMATKEVMVSAPLVVLLFDRALVSDSWSAVWRARKKLHVAYFGCWLLLAVCLVLSGGRGASAGFNGSLAWWRYALTQVHAIILYLRLAFWPEPLVLDYGRFVVAGFSSIAAQLLLLAVLGAATIFAWVRRPAVGFLGAAFFLVLAPSSSVVPVIAQTMAEHRMYLPLAAVTSLVVLGSFAWLGARCALGWLAVGVALGLATFQRNHDYRSAEAIWADTVAKQPENSRAWYCLGIELLPAKRFAESAAAFARALKLDPGNPETMIGYANALASLGEEARAIELYGDALGRLPRDYPMSYEARHNLGVLLTSGGHPDQAIEHLRVAVELRPGAVDSRFSLGNALAVAGKTEEAIAQFEAALAIDPASIPARYRVANLLLQNGRCAEAARHYEKMIALLPDSVEAHNELGIAYAQLGRPAEARTQFEAALRLKPDYPGVQENLARLRSAP